VIFGSAVDNSLDGRIRVSVVATGIDSYKQAEQPRPKLVAVGGGAAPAPAPIVMRGAAPASAAPVFMPAAVQAPTLLRQASPQPEMAAVGDVSMQSVPQQRPVMQQQLRPTPEPLVQLAAKANLFAEQRPMAMPSQSPAQPVADPGRPSLFNAVTGAFRRRAMPAPAPAAQPQSMRREPAMEDYQPQPAPTPAQPAPVAEQTGLEIPAFLRRQQSH
jgi:cell division protein FtsZ